MIYPKEVREFVEFVRRESAVNCTMWQLTLTSHGYEVATSARDGVDLERNGVIMRNLRGELITAAVHNNEG